MNEYPNDWHEIAYRVKRAAGFCCVRCHRPNNPATGYTLTVHHLDMDKANCELWNLAPLCQRCHLKIQSRVKMNQMYMFDHAGWMQPFIDGKKEAIQHG